MQRMLIPYHGIILLEKSQNIKLVDGTVHITLCAMAIEAFFQDLRSYYQSIGKIRPYPAPKTLKSLFKPTKDTRYAGGGAMISGQMETLCELEQKLWNTIKELEWKSLFKKYETTLNLLAPSWNKNNDDTYRNFKTLIELRNSLVHIKSEELNISEEGEILTPNSIQGKLPNIKLNTGEKQSSWIEALDSSDIITWARSTTDKIIIQILKLLPDTAISNNFRADYYSKLCTLER